MKVISSIENDVSTFEIMDWLWYLRKEVKPIYLEKLVEHIDIEISDEVENIILDNIDFNEVTGHFYRQGDYIKKLGFRAEDKNAKVINTYLSKEWEVLKMFLHNSLESKYKSIGAFNKEINNNKLDDLFLAKKVGFKIPKTLVTTRKRVLQNFYDDNNSSIITKPLRHAININCDKFSFSGQGTKRVLQRNIDNLDDYFFPVFVQEEIDKLIELRVFVFHEQIYSMAIFSQENENTRLDYRNYDDDKPNRNVPYNLPHFMEKLVLSFMDKSGLNTGSLDIILNSNGEHIFLEVNPIGQFDWLSKDCNYYIEKQIANFL